MSSPEEARADLGGRIYRRSSKLAIVFALLALATSTLWLALGHASSSPGLRGVELVPRAPYVPAPFPLTAALRGLPPSSTDADPQAPSKEIRAIDVSPAGIRLRSGGAVDRHLAVPLGRSITPHRLVRLIDDPAWIEEPVPGQFIVGAALVLHHGIGLEAVAPGTGAIRMVDRPGVVLGIEDPSTSRFEGVAITTVADAALWAGADVFRPSLAFAHGASVSFDGCRIHHLGWDWNASYGLSWMNGSTGSIRNTTVREDFIGLYSQKVKGLVIAKSRFTENHLYGIDPHTRSSGLEIVGNRTDHNAAHGIILAEGVVRSVLRGNQSTDNGENGVMMDAGSSGNRIEANVIERNRGDGIVLADSDRTSITGNSIRANRVGLQVRAAGPQGRITGNTIAGNEVTMQGIEIDPQRNQVEGSALGVTVQPASQWRWIVLFNLLPLTIVMGIAALVVRRRELRSSWEQLERRGQGDASRPPKGWRDLQEANRELLVDEAAALDRSSPLPS